VPDARIVAEGLVWPEGPALLDDGRIAFVETYASKVSVWSPEEGVRLLADTGGGPNAVCLGEGGYLYVTQNSGLVGAWQAERMQPGCIQRVSIADGSVEVLATEVGSLALRMPNDLAFGPDGRLYFSDPGLWDPEGRSDPGYIVALDVHTGLGEVLAELDPVYPNGVVVERDGSVVWVESYTRRVRRLLAGGEIEDLATFADPLAVPDGLAIAADGDLYVTALTAGGLRIVGADGSDRGRVDVGAVPSNCCFAGDRLFITDGGDVSGTAGSTAPQGRLWCVELGVEGQELFRGSSPPANNPDD
jgi:gluconolactonase